MQYSQIEDPSGKLKRADHNLIYVCLSGELRLDVAFEERTIARGEAFFCGAGLEHLVLDQDALFGFQIVISQEEWISAKYHSYEFMKVSLPRAAVAIAEDILLLRDDISPNPVLLSAIVFYAHQEMAKSCGWMGTETPWFSHLIARVSDVRLQKASELLMSRFADQVDLDLVAKQSGLSARSMRRLFQECFGMSPTEALRSLRMEHAIPLVRATKLSIEEIACRCGYENTASFSRDFAMTFSSPPGRYRGKLRGQTGKQMPRVLGSYICGAQQSCASSTLDIMTPER
jgi:AraC-like DNA-binding protein